MAERETRQAREPFSACVNRIEKALATTGIRLEGRIVTSRDEAASQLTGALAIPNMADGFQKWQLPIYHKGPTHLFVTVAEPGATVASHNHEGASTRFIINGSIAFAGKQLTAGDWMFIPANADYSFDVGQFGAVIAGQYEC